MSVAEPSKKGGHHGLETVRENPDADVDIVAVHGLGANSEHCWRYQEKIDGRVTGKNINWLEDDNLLPSEIPNARVLAFNYNSDWLVNGTKIELWDLAEELMRELYMDRDKNENEKAKHRPIIFIGHSFGGIIIEQGLVNASFAASQYKLIPRCTVGVVTLGVPHSGSQSAGWGTVIGEVSSAFGLGGEPTLVKELTEGSKKLAEIVHQYMMWVSTFAVEVTQFFETQQTNYGARFGVRVNRMVVPKESACLPGYPAVPLLSDHFKLAKYSGPNDPSYMKVMPVIKKMAAAAPEKAKLRFDGRTFVQDNSLIPAVHLECQKALFIAWPNTELEGIKRRLGERTPATCEWLLSREEYNEWMLNQRPQVMRLVGDPGMGKSMIITFLIEKLTTRLGVTPNMVLAYHFCDNRNQSSNTAQAVVRMMLFQLFQQRPQHFHFLQKAYDIQGNKLFSDFPEMWRIFLEVLAHYGDGFESSEVFLLIDALDECDEESRELLMQGLKKVSNSRADVRIFFTCRPEADIEMHHKNDGIKTLSCIIGPDDLNGDIEKFINDKVPKLCTRKGWDGKIVQQISDDLRRKAKGIFLWCAFVLEDIEKVRQAEITKTLQSLPKNLTEVYRRITGLFRPGDKEVATMVLDIVAGARRPLELDELTMTYVLAENCPKDNRWVKNQLPPDEEIQTFRDVYETCTRLLRFDQPTNTVNLVHQSAKDYLLQEYLKEPDQPADEKTNVRLNNLFLELIFRYFSLEDFDHLQYRMVFDAEWDIDWECSWWEMEPSPPFLKYCGREWELHCKDAEKHPVRGMDGFIKWITPANKLRKDDSDSESDDDEEDDIDDAEKDGGELKVRNPRSSVINSWLRKAAVDGNKSFVEFLLRKGADRDSTDFRGWTALAVAAKAGQLKIVDFLVIEKDAPINADPPHIDGRTPIQTAAEVGNVKMLKKLIKLKANLNQLPAKINGRTALQAAAEKGLGETVQFLVDQKQIDCNVEGAEVSGVTALLAAAGSGGEWQMGKNIHRTIKQRSRLPGSAEIDTKKIAEEDQQDRNQRLEEESNHENVVRILVRSGAKIIPNKFNWTALHAAVERESDQMVDDMLEKFNREDCNIKGTHDGTPLHSAKAKANEELAEKLEKKGGSDECPYSKLDLDAMMKYIRAVLTRLMIRSNTERFFFIQSYIPIYHVIYSYCAEGADDQNDNPPVEQGGRRGELVYRDVDAWLKSYVKWNQKFINDTPRGNDFLTVYIREWKLFKRGAYYVGRMLRYLTRHWVKHQREELKHLDVRDIADLFFHRWRVGMTSEVRRKIKKEMIGIEHRINNIMKNKDTRVLDAINESLGCSHVEFPQVFKRAEEYFRNFKDLDWDNENTIENFEVILRDLTDEFVVQSEEWKLGKEIAQKSHQEQEQFIRHKKHNQLLSFAADNFHSHLWNNESAEFYLNTVEPHFLAPYSGGRTAEIRRDLDRLWDMMRDRPDEAKMRAEWKAKNLQAVNANVDHEVNGIHADGEDTHMANGIQQTSSKEATETTA